MDGVREGVGTFDVHVVAAGEDALRGVRAEFDELFLESEAFLFKHRSRNIEIVVVAAFRSRQYNQRPRTERTFLRRRAHQRQ